ncbi:hypothetical protein JCM15519_38160 [Fundidesulfovibrio butyratiphilus]
MGFKDNIKKLKEVAGAAKDKAVNFVSEEVIEYESGPNGKQIKTRKVKQWVKTTGAVAATFVAAVAVKKGYDALSSSSNGSQKPKLPGNLSPQQAYYEAHKNKVKPVPATSNNQGNNGSQPSKAKEVASAVGALFGGFAAGVASFNNQDISLDNLIRSSSNIESLLEDKGAVGKGLHEKVSSIESELPESSVKSIRFIASIRNQLVHEGPDTVSFEKKRDYLEACQRVERDLNSIN